MKPNRFGDVEDLKCFFNFVLLYTIIYVKESLIIASYCTIISKDLTYFAFLRNNLLIRQNHVSLT